MNYKKDMPRIFTVIIFLFSIGLNSAFSQGNSNTAKLDLSLYKKGRLIYEEDFDDFSAYGWDEDITILKSGVASVITSAAAHHGTPARMYTLADRSTYNDVNLRKKLENVVPNDITNSIIEFDLKLISADQVTIAFGDKLANAYCHAGHISRIYIYKNQFLMRDDMGYYFGKRQIEKDKSLSKKAFDSIIQVYYPDEDAHKASTPHNGIQKDKWYTIRVVHNKSLMEFWISEKGKPLQLKLSLNAPGRLDGYLPQTNYGYAEEIGRDNTQPRGLDHFKTRWGFTVPISQTKDLEIHFDNVKIYEVVQL